MRTATGLYSLARLRTLAAVQIPGPATVDTIRTLFDALDYKALGPLYCDEGGEAFWEDRRGPAEELGCRWAHAVAPRLSRGGRSLYVGAGVAELPAMVTEVLDLDRTLAVSNRLPAECKTLNRSLKEVGLDDRIRFAAGPVEEWIHGAGKFDHVTMVSVLVDPDWWPQVSGVTYGRLPPVLVDVQAFTQERENIQQLIRALFDVLDVEAGKAVITTSVEEVSWFVHEAKARGLTIEADDDTVETAIIGDPIGFLTVG